VGLQGLLLTEPPQEVLPHDQPQEEEVSREDSSDNSVNMLNCSNVINNSSSSVYSSCSNVSSSRVILPDKNKLKVLFSNVDTLTNKCNELQVYLDTESPDIIGLCVKFSPKMLWIRRVYQT
jgi:hypothetical protein